MNKQQIYTALDNMDRFGGSFVASLAKEYWEDYNFDSVLYEVIEFHDSLSEAREHKRRLLNG